MLLREALSVGALSFSVVSHAIFREIADKMCLSLFEIVLLWILFGRFTDYTDH